MHGRNRIWIVLLLTVLVLAPGVSNASDPALDVQLEQVLAEYDFTGNVEATLTTRLGRPLDPGLVELGRLLFFDEVLSLRNDNACAGCHSPTVGFGDPQSIAYGVANNRIVGPGRDGTRNERRAPLLTNVAFFPNLMLNGRFAATSGDPFDNSQGFTFPPPNDVRFATPDPLIPNLLTAQAFMPVRSLEEMAGFQGTAGTIGPRFDQFDDGVGTPVPPPPNRDDGIWGLVLERLNGIAEYRSRFEAIFGAGDVIFPWVGQAIAEFQLSLLAADAPLDQFARGNSDAMTDSQKRGALLFFRDAGCVQCHAVNGAAPEMFSDFESHVLAIPQIHPEFGAGSGNIIADGPGEDEDFGRFRISGDPQDLYAFRTSPIRNLAVQPAFFHNGAFLTLKEAIQHHLDAAASAIDYDPAAAGIEEDLHDQGPIQPVIERLDPLLQSPILLDPQELSDLVGFVNEALLDSKALPENLCDLVPEEVPSGQPLPLFETCRQHAVTICHKGRTKVVPSDAVASHLDHGDHVGRC